MSTSVPIQKVLIANRGEIARRIIRTCRRLGKKTVAVFSEADKDALYGKEADESYCIGPSAPNLSYLNIPEILRVAKACGADAIHPGYGFLAESEEFSAAVTAAGICFLGPTSAALRALGEKDRARALAESLQIPIAKGFVLKEQTPAALSALAPALSFPLLLKAVSGGGGRGMRIVPAESDLLSAVQAASREAEQFFGSGALIVEEFVRPARHVEVQLIADTQGNVLHLYERDCSTQRRNQKVVEESPARNISGDLLQKLYESSVALAKAGGLHGLATAEFLVRLDEFGNPNGEFVFLEVNPRIQVEHPVTEMITGIDLVEEHLHLAEGHALRFQQGEIRRVGHAIQARIYAEIPELGFLPSAGTVDGLQLPQEQSCLLRVEHCLEDGVLVNTLYDSMLAKLVAWGKTFEEARQTLLQALADTALPGVANNIRFLENLLRETHFSNSELAVHFLGDWEIPAVTEVEGKLALLSAFGVQAVRGQENFGELSYFRPGLSRSSGIHRLSQPMRTWKVQSSNAKQPFFLDCRPLSIEKTPDFLNLEVETEGEQKKFLCRRIGPRAFEVQFGSKSISVQIAAEETPLGDTMVRLNTLHQDWTLLPLPIKGRESSLGTQEQSGDVLSPLPGTVLKVLFEEGESIERGQTLFILDSMKTEHQVYAPLSGKMQDLRVGPGSKVLTSSLLCRIG